MSKWFEEVFLKSLFDRTGVNQGLWLTQKQTAVCVNNMVQNQSCPEAEFGYYRHLYYTAEYEGRKVRMDYSKMNGCGTIVFYCTKEEIEENRKRSEEYERQIKLEKLKFLAEKKPERIIKKIERIKRDIADWYEFIEEEMEDEETDLKAVANAEKEVELLNEELFEICKAVKEYWRY